MKRIIFILIISFLVFFITKVSPAQTGRALRTVVIDAGHGGRDPGAIGKNSREKDINLAIALKLGKLIENNLPELRVIYTRKTDIFIPLHQRSKIANDNQADFFISIHCNSNPSSKIYGAETYVMGLHKSQDNLEVAKLENSSILKEENYSDYYEGFNPNSAEAYIIFSLYQNASLDHSLDLASKIQDQFKALVGVRDRGVLQAGFLVLYRTTMPGVLVETGYISNISDEKYLMSKNGQNFIASAIYRALKEYKNEQGIQSAKLTDNASKKKIETTQSLVGVLFRVQIVTSSTKINLNSKRFNNLKTLYEYQHNGMYKYCTGESNSFSKMDKLKVEMQKEGFKDAFVVAFKDELRISVSEARKLTEK
ncbi:MAG: N-acetylmuramoyl-L-alanine amidase [Bacteroidetes bacterium]|nr:N-acetylmuramoyl-L-alanine amidase [Bacteroidota bacterium]